MDRGFRFVLTALASFFSLGVIAFCWLHLQPPASRAETRTPSPPVVVVSHPLRQEMTDEREYAGRFEPSAAVEVRARVGGHLQSISVADGELVEAGQVLFMIDPRPYRLARASAQAQLDSAIAELELAELELARAERQMESDTVTQAALDQRRHSKREAFAGRAVAAAELQRAEINLEFTDIRAPFKGRISYRRFDVGALVGEGEMLTHIVALDPVYFVFDMSEQDLLEYKRSSDQPNASGPMLGGTAVEVWAQGRDGAAQAGLIDFVDNRIENGAGTIRVRARLPNEDQQITPGQFGRIRLPFSEKYHAVLVPETALLVDQGQRILLTVTEDGTVRSSPVDLGSRIQNGLRIVRKGVTVHDRIITSGLLRARPGQKVSPQMEPPLPRTASITENLME